MIEEWDDFPPDSNGYISSSGNKVSFVQRNSDGKSITIKVNDPNDVSFTVNLFHCPPYVRQVLSFELTITGGPSRFTATKKIEGSIVRWDPTYYNIGSDDIETTIVDPSAKFLTTNANWKKFGEQKSALEIKFTMTQNLMDHLTKMCYDESCSDWGAWINL